MARWIYQRPIECCDPTELIVTAAVRQKESDIRPFSDDQNIVIGYACSDERTNYLPVAQWNSGELGRQLFAQIRGDRELSSIFGPDFKLLASLEVKPEFSDPFGRLTSQETLNLVSAIHG